MPRRNYWQATLDHSPATIGVQTITLHYHSGGVIYLNSPDKNHALLDSKTSDGSQSVRHMPDPVTTLTVSGNVLYAGKYSGDCLPAHYRWLALWRHNTETTMAQRPVH